MKPAAQRVIEAGGGTGGWQPPVQVRGAVRRGRPKKKRCAISVDDRVGTRNCVGVPEFPRAQKKTCPATQRITRRVFPFGGSSIACRCANRVAPSCAPSREGSVLLGVLLCERLTGTLGSPFPAATSAFSAVSCGVSSSAVHLRLAPKASSSRELSASSRVLRPANCPSCLF